MRGGEAGTSPSAPPSVLCDEQIIIIDVETRLSHLFVSYIQTVPSAWIQEIPISGIDLVETNIKEQTATNTEPSA